MTIQITKISPSQIARELIKYGEQMKRDNVIYARVHAIYHQQCRCTDGQQLLRVPSASAN